MAEELVDSFRKQAETQIKAARMHYDNWVYHASISSAQVAIELTLKALLKRYIGDFPKKHDVSGELALSVDKLPEHLREKVPRLCFISRVVTAWKEPSIYGEELRQTPPERLLGKKEAELAISYAEEVRLACFPFLY